MITGVEKSFANSNIGRTAGEASFAVLEECGRGRDGHLREVDFELSCPLIMLIWETAGGPLEPVSVCERA